VQFLCCGAVLFTTVAMGTELNLCPTAFTKISMDGHSVLKVWGVPGVASTVAITANPDYDWPTEMAIATWRDAILTAKKNGTCLTIYYDPVTFELWSTSE